jgi:hypothetical protein
MPPTHVPPPQSVSYVSVGASAGTSVPLPIVSVTVPPSCTSSALAVNVPAGFTLATVTVLVAVPVAPLGSVTVRVAVKVPLSPYVWLGFASVDVLPSPKFQRYVSGCASGSTEPALENAIATPSFPLYGPFAVAVGGELTPTTAV